MVISWLGQACFKIQSGDLVIVIDPFSKDIGLTPPRFRADLVLVTHGHYDHSNSESLTGEPLVITGPGEYEAKGVYVHGIQTFHDTTQGKERGLNTIYSIELEDMKLLHLGDFGENALREETLESVGDADIVMIPVGGKYTVDGEGAAKIVKQLEPRLVIPMHYKIPGLKIGLAGAEEFLKEMGAAKIEAQEKLVIKKRDVGEEEKTEVALLKPV
ncbi:MAG: MBL fold metallo-hydrolase [Candidatus Sungbacteria bacterium]|nr:MBL fold metallo-hydrolase [Candidatus Sungbacteria bacterium]